MGFMFAIKTIFLLVKHGKPLKLAVVSIVLSSLFTISTIQVFGNKSNLLAQPNVNKNSKNLYTIGSLQRDFNLNKNKVRIFSLLSPACNGCVKGHEIVKKILKSIESEKIFSQIVWLPIVKNDSYSMALTRANSLSDKRVRNYWSGDRYAGNIFTKTLNLDRTAWDVYLVYEAGVVWEDEKIPPAPTYWMHQLWGQPKENFLNPEMLRRKVNSLL